MYYVLIFILGFLIGYLIAKLYNKKEDKKEDKSISIFRKMPNKHKPKVNNDVAAWKRENNL